MKYIAFITKGVEEISKKELLTLETIEIYSVSDKYIQFQYSGDISKLKSLKTIDDIAILINEFNLEDLNFLNKLINYSNFQIAVQKVKNELRETDKTFSITVSVYKNDEIDKEELKEMLSKVLDEELDLKYTPLIHSNLDLRINIEENKGFISLKLFRESLFRREYLHESSMGSLRSTIASAMIFNLSNGKTDLKLVDNFCGSGTFLCEGVAQGLEVYGGDISSKQVERTKENISKTIKLLKLKKEFELNRRVRVLDAKKSKWGDRFFDIAISNYPWDKQIKEKSFMELYSETIKEYSRVLKPNGSLGIIGTKPEIAKKYIKQYFPNHLIQEKRIGYIGQTPTMLYAVRST